jgi:prepilin-type N-terminal cleavage/methylation domain-containing protein
MMHCTKTNRRRQISSLRPRRKRGISLLEILVAIFILSVGLLGVASLIPVGNSEVIKASIAHRSAETGLRAFREMRLRGYLNPQNWLAGGISIVDPETGSRSFPASRS